MESIRGDGMNDPIPRYAQLDVWMALGGNATAFEDWRDERTFADAWAALMCAVKGDLLTLLADTNPPAGALLSLRPRRDAMNGRERLFEKGQGWLRWGTEERTAYYWESNACAYAPERYWVAPPLRRLALYLKQWLRVPRLMLMGLPPDEISPKRYRFSWEEARPIWPSDMRDDDRRGKK